MKLIIPCKTERPGQGLSKLDLPPPGMLLRNKAKKIKKMYSALLLPLKGGVFSFTPCIGLELGS